MTPGPLPRAVRDLLVEWDLERETDEVWGRFSVCVPVRTAEGERTVLKVAHPGQETRHEALALQRWGGDGAVRLLRADPHRRAVLLERLDRRDLTEEWDVHACEVVAGLYSRLHVPAPPQLLLLTEYVGQYVEPLRALPRDAPLPRRMVEQCLAHLRDLLVDPVSTGVTTHGDLHYLNVLERPVGADGQPEWVAIDPQAMSGDPHWEPAPLLWNRLEEAAGDVRRTVLTRFEAIVDTAGLDEDRARAWTVVRLVVNALWTVQDAGDGPLDSKDLDWITRVLTVCKAIQP